MCTTQDQLSRIVAAHLRRPVSPTASWDELRVDSLSMAELLGEVEDEFGMQLDEQVFQISSVAALALHIDQTRGLASVA